MAGVPEDKEPCLTSYINKAILQSIKSVNFNTFNCLNKHVVLVTLFNLNIKLTALFF